MSQCGSQCRSIEGTASELNVAMVAPPSSTMRLTLFEPAKSKLTLNARPKIVSGTVAER